MRYTYATESVSEKKYLQFKLPNMLENSNLYVITSYSIHYTKLYDWIVEYFEKARTYLKEKRL